MRWVAHGLVAVLVATLCAVVTPATPAAAVGETLALPSATRIAPSTSNAAISDAFDIAGYLSTDTLLANISLSGPSGTSFSIPTTTGLTLGYGYSSWTGVTVVSFTGTQANINAALDSLTVSTGATSGTAILTVSTTLSTSNVYYYATNGHFYQAVSSSGTTWTTANTNATAATYKGRPGYLVTITDANEQAFLNNNVSGNNIWIGLTDKDCEGTWKWQGGPEAGQTAFQATANTGCANTTSSYSSAGTSLLYTNWCSGEPNNSDGATGEDMAVTKWSGGTCWNDLRDGNSSGVSGYVIEYGDAQAFTDFLSGNMTIAVSNTPGLVASVTSDKLNGTYGNGTAIDIKVNFTDPVNVTGSPTLTLNAGGTHDAGAVATYLSGSGTSTLVFRYTVLEGNSTSDLNYSATNSLALNGGTITLVSNGANATLTLPATSANESLGGSKNLVVSSTSDSPSSTGSITATYTNSQSVTVSYTATDPSTTIRSVTAYYSTSSSLTSPVSCGTTTSATSPNTVTCTLATTNTTYYVYTRATDAAGNVEAAPVSADDSIILDTVAPAFSTLSASPNPVAASSGQTATITFSLNESVTSFTASDVSVTYGTISNFSGSGASYTATFTPTRSSSGPAVLTVAAGSIVDSASNSNALATLTISISATNGRTTYTSGGTTYVVERFTANGTWVAPQGITAINALVVGGGGGAGSRGAGGGGAGGFVEANSYAVTAGANYNVTVGAGGAGAAASTANSGTGGSASSFLLSGVGLTANGGAGGNSHSVANAPGGNSGSGSGTGGTAYQNNGGTGATNNSCGSSDWCGGGGGGAGSAGGAAVSGGGNGGSGRASSITGTSVTYAGGGGGGGGSSGTPSSSPSPGGSGSAGGGGAGGTPTWNGSTCLPADGINGTNGLGGGGGGGGYCDSTTATYGQGTGGTGGSGVVIVSYALPSISTPDLDAASDLGTSSTDNKTSDTTPTFIGTAPVGAEVQLYVNGSASGSVCYANDTSGQWSCTTATLTSGTYSITAVASTTLETSIVTSTSAPLSVSINTYTLTYDSQGGSAVTGGQWTAGSAITLPTPTRAGYSFAGWSTTAAGSTKMYETTQPYRTGNNIVYTSGYGKGASDAAATATNNGVTFNRVRYRMEANYNSVLRYADVSFDKWSGATISSLAVPDLADTRVIKTNVSNLSIDSNWPGFAGVASAVTTGTGKTGRLELWPWDYATTTSGGLASPGSSSVYDSDDTNSGTGTTYGSFQVHNLTDNQTVLAWNRHYDTTASGPDIGFGNFLGTGTGGQTGNTDWTFAQKTNFNLATWKLGIYIGDLYSGGASYTPTDTADFTLYAQWTADPYSVTYNGNNNSGGTVPTDASTYNYGNTVTVLGNTGTLTKSGYTFSGWCTTQPAVGSSCSGTSRAAASTFSITGATTLYAVWLDTTPPSISSFGSSTADGSYKAAAAINITATASESVQSGNTITVTLDTGATVTLTAPSAGTTLTGTYTVAAGQNSADLTVSSFTIGTVADTAGNAMTSTTVPTGANNIAGAKAIVIDTTAPTLDSFTSTDSTPTASATLTYSMTFSEAVTGVAAGDFSNAGTALTCSFAPGADSGATRTLTITSCGDGTVIPRFALGGASDAAANTGPAAATDATTTITRDTTAPTYSSAAVNTAGTQLTLTYGETLHSTTAPTSAFTVTNAGIPNPVSAVAISGSTVILTLTEVIYSGQAVTFTYTDPTAGNDANAIQDLAGNDAVTKTSTSATNNATGTIPRAARLIGLGTETVVTVSGLTGGTRGITSDGTYVYFRNSGDLSKIYRVAISSISTGSTATTSATSWTVLDSVGANSTTGTNEQTQLVYSSGCLFYLTADDSNSLKCIDVNTHRISSVTVPAAKTLPSGHTWLVGNLVSFPDGRIGKLGTQVLSGSTYVSTLRLYTVSGTGNSATLTWSEDMTLNDTADWPTDDHGFSTDGVYGYRINHAAGYKVWRLQSGAASNIIFNGSGTGTCGGSGTLCPIIINSNITNATYIGYDASSNRYFVGDYGANKFYMTESANPGVGPGTAPITVNSFSSAVSSPTTNTSPAYTLTFNTAVTGVAAGDFTNTGTSTCSFAVTAVSTTVYTVTPTCTTDGTIRPQFAANAAVLQSNGTSTGPAFAAAASTTLTIAVPPTITSFTSSTADGTYKAGATINITATVSEAIPSGSTMTVTLNASASAVTLTAASQGTTLTGTYTVAAGNTSADLTVSSYTVGTVADLAGNAMSSTALPTGANIADTSNIAIDTTSPTVVSFTSSQSTPTSATSFTYTITFSEAVTGVASGDFSNSGTAGGCTFDPGSDASSTLRTVTVSGCARGTVIPVFAVNGASDAVGNTGPATAGTSSTTITRNSTPALSTPSTASYTDTIAVDTFSNSTGTLVGSDADAGDTLTYSITGGTDGGTTVSKVGTYGTLTVTKSTGAYTYAPNTSAIQALAANASETFTVTTTDPGTASASATFTVSVSAVNDAPVISTTTLSFLDTAASDTFTIQTGTLSATDAESNTISSWTITGGTTGSYLYAPVTYTRMLVGTYGTLWVEATTGKYRFAPANSAINGLTSGTSENYPITATDSASVVGSGSLTVSITAVNDKPVVTVTVTALADVTDGLATSAYSLYHSSASGGGSSPASEQVSNAFDGSSGTKYLNFSGAGSGVSVDLGAGNAYAVTGIGLTTANDSQERDPASFTIYGSSDNSSFTQIASGALSPPTARQTDYPTVTFTNSAAYRYYRVVFPTIRGGGADSYLQVAEIRLPATAGGQLTYTEGSAAGVVLTGIDVTDADTASLTGGTVSITAGLTTGDVLAFTNDGSTMGSISGTYNSSTGVLTLTGTGTPTQYQNAFRAVTFRNTSNNPTSVSTTRTISWQANDGDASNNLSTVSTSTVTVVETTATITSVAVTSSAGSDNRYAVGDAIEVSVTFSEAMTVTGTPRMAVNGLSSKYFTYSSGSGTSTLIFSYTVATGDSAASGIGVVANALSLNGGTIKDSANAAATITHSAVAVSTSHIVDGVVPTIVSFSSSTADGSYKAAQTINVTATASETIQASSSIVATLDTGATVTLTAASAGTTLTGTYTIAAGQNSSDLTVSSFTITSAPDLAGNAMTSTTVPSGTSNIAGAKAIIIDTVAPTITRMAVSADGYYKAGQTITITATASESLRSGNTITVTFDTGETLTLTAASAGTTLTGTYTVTAGINSTDLTVASFTIGTALDTAGNAMTSTTMPTGSNAIGPGTAVIIDTTAPTVVSFSSSTANGSYRAGQTVSLTATVSEPIGSSNSISVTLNSGATVTLSTPADSTTWSGGGCGPFSRRTVTGSLSGGSVWGSGPYTSDSDFNKAAVHAGLVAVGETAVIEPYAVNYYATFTGSTQNGVTTSNWTSGWCGYSIRLATAQSGTTSTTLTGTYTIASGNSASSLNVSSFSIVGVYDGAGNAMTSTAMPSGFNIADASSLAVDTAAPTITSFSSTTANGAYKAGDTVNVTATASESVRAGNTISATLNSGRTVTLTAASAGQTFSGTYTVIAGDTAADLTVSSFTIGTVLDTAGNAMTSTTLPTGTNNIGGAKDITIDTAPPTVVSLTTSQPSPTSSTSFTYALTMSEAVTGIAADDFTNTGTATCSFDPGSDAASTSRTISVTCSSKGTVTPRFAAFGAADAAGNAGPATASTSGSTVTINNAPTFGAATTITYSDTSAADSFGTQTGDLGGNDLDSGDVLTYGITGGTAGATVVTKVGTYGTLTVTKATGSYGFTPNGSVIEARSTDVSETFVVTVTDGIQTTSSVVTIAITATNDLPIISPVSFSFTDTSAKDTFGTQTGTFSAVDAESNTISSWGMTGATSGSWLLAWTSGSVTFDNKLTGTYGTLYVQSNSGKYRFEPINAAINGASTSTSESYPVTATDSASSVGILPLNVIITATNDKPIVTVTVASLADVTDNLPSSAYTLYHSTVVSGGSSPSGEQVWRAFDNSTSTKYLNFSGAGSGVTIDLGAGASYAVTGLGLTTANDSPDRNPTSYAIYGSNDNTSYALVSSGSLSAPNAYFAAYPDITFANSTQYRWYRVVFPTVNGSSMMQISEIRLPARSGNPLTYTEGSPAGVVLTGIDVADADTATLSGGTVAISSGLTTGDVLTFTNDGATMGSIVGSYDSSTGILSLSGTGTPTDYQNAFRAVMFRNTTNSPTANSGTRTVTWQVDDNQSSNNLSTTATSTITIVETYATITATSFTSSSGSDNLYGLGDSITFDVSFSERVDVTGLPRIAINGLSGRYLTYVSGSGSTTLNFSYTVAAGDAAAGGIGVAANSLALNGGSIKDSALANAVVTHSAVATAASRGVDGNIPTVSGITSAMSSPTNLTSLTFTITFAESVTDITADDFSNGGNATGCMFDPGADNGSTRTITVTACSGGTVTPVFASNGAVDAAGNVGPVAAASASTTITRRFQRTISFSATSFSKTYGDSTFTVSASPTIGGGDGAVSYSASGNCSVGSSSGLVTITGAGTCSIGAAAAQGMLHMAATTTSNVSVTVAPKPLTITASTHALTYGDPTPTITPTYSPFAYNETAADLTTQPTCTTSYTNTSTALVDIATNCTAATSPNYDITYTAGNITIAKQPTEVTFTSSSLSVAFDGTIKSASASTTPAGKKLKFTYQSLATFGSPLVNPPMNAGTYAVVATVDEANFVGSAFATMTIDKATQTPIAFANSTKVTYGNKLQLVSTGGSGSGALRFTVRLGKCIVSATGELSSTAAGTCTVRASKAASANFLAASSSDLSVTVEKQDQSIAFVSALPSSPIPGSSYIPGAKATSGLTPAITISTGADVVCSLKSGVVTFFQNGLCVITAQQSGNSNYTAAQPVSQSVTVGRVNQTITFAQPEEHRIGEAPFNLGASASSGLVVSYDAQGIACSVSSVGVVTILAPGTCDITASQSGDGTYAPASPIARTLIVRAGLPGVPHLMSASPGDSSIIASYSAPPTDGGSPIVSYVVVATPVDGDPTSRSDCSITLLTCSLVGLSNGTSYRVKVAAVTEAGVGDFSAESEEVTPFVAPEAVRDLAGVRRDDSLQLSWVDPSSLGGGTLLRYEVSYREVGGEFGDPTSVTVSSAPSVRVASLDSSTRRTTLSGLSKGKTYDVKVVTVTNLASAPSPTNTAEAVVQKMNVSEPPRNLSAEATSLSTATVAWATPLRDGGSPITAYSVSSSSGTCAPAGATALSCELTGAESGTKVTIKVRATTKVGVSDVATTSITMPGRPGAPKITSVYRQGTSATLVWAAPASDGGRSITSYRITGTSTIDSKDAPICSSTELACTVQGLSMSAAYNFTVRAFNAFGEGATSEPYFAQAFSAVPSAWGSVSAAPGVRAAAGLPPAPGSVKVLAAAAGRSSVIATAPKSAVPVTHAIITVAGSKGRVVLRVKVAVNQSNPQASVTIPYASSKVRVAVQFANAYGVSPMVTNGWKPSNYVTSQSDAAANVQRGVTTQKLMPVGTVVGSPVYFVGASSTLSPATKAELARIATAVKRDGGIVNVTGYARRSPDTSTSFLQRVSQDRALVVANYLATLGVQQWVRYQGVGAPTTTTGSDTDRRVVVSLTSYED